MAVFYYPRPCPEEEKVRKQTQAFVDGIIRKTALADDTDKRFRPEWLKEAGRLGLTSLILPSKEGKTPPFSCYLACLEEIARGSLSFAITLAVTTLNEGCILNWGSDEQKRKYLPLLAEGKALGAFSLSEPQSGSDAASLLTQAKKVPGGYSLTGTKSWCSSAGFADFYVVMARTSEDRTQGISAFIVEKSDPGFTIGKQETKLGLHASPLAQLLFENCKLPESRLLGKVGEGLKVALSQLDAGRLGVSAASLGLCREALERAWHWKGSGEFPPVTSHNLGEWASKLQAAKLLLWTAAHEKDLKKPITQLAAQSKLLLSDLAMHISSEVVTALGPEGASRLNEVERLFREAKAMQIVEGTNQIQRQVIAREIEKSLKP